MDAVAGFGQAFRKAAATILPLPEPEVAERVDTGTLTELPSIGPSTASVIEAAVRGEMPERLAKLEAAYAGPLTEGGREIRAALRGDLHSHSDWSDGGSPIEEMAFTAIELLVSRQLAVPTEERNQILQKLATMEVELAKPDTDLTVIKQQRDELASSWPWLNEEMEVLFRQPAVEREMAEAARRFMSGD